jgi:hypothetical protein
MVLACHAFGRGRARVGSEKGGIAGSGSPFSFARAGRERQAIVKDRVKQYGRECRIKKLV